MDAPLTFHGQKPWTNTPEARTDIKRTSAQRARARRRWSALQEHIVLAQRKPFSGPGFGYYEDATYA